MKLSWITGCLLLFISGCLEAEKLNHAPEHILAMENATVYGEDDVANADTLMLDREQVFGDKDENPIASFPWPRDSDIKIVRNNKMYAEKTDPETGTKLVMGYDVEYSE